MTCICVLTGCRASSGECVGSWFFGPMPDAGDLIFPINRGSTGDDPIHAEQGEIVAGFKEEQVADDEVTLFKSVGGTVQDVAAADRVLAAAEWVRVGI